MTGGEFDDAYFRRLEGARGHWWTLGMQRVSESLLRGASALDGDALDAGCGSGTSLAWLVPSVGGTVHGLDVALPGLVYCRSLGLPVALVQGSATALPYRDASVDLLLCTDVLQHLPREEVAAALGDMARVLRPGGRMLVRTNAVFGRKRVPERADWHLYDPERLARELTGAGLNVERLTYANALQGLWASLPRPWRRVRAYGHDHHGHDHHGHAHNGHDDHGHGVRDHNGHGLGIPAPVHPVKNRLLLGVLDLEARWLTRGSRSLPFGHTLLALAGKSGPLRARSGAGSAEGPADGAGRC